RFPGADAEHDPIRKHDSKRAKGLRHDGRMIAKGGRHHTRANGDPRRERPEGAEPCEREGSVPAVMLPWQEMVTDKDRVKARLLRETRKLEQFRRPELLRR